MWICLQNHWKLFIWILSADWHISLIFLFLLPIADTIFFDKLFHLANLKATWHVTAELKEIVQYVLSHLFYFVLFLNSWDLHATSLIDRANCHILESKFFYQNYYRPLTSAALFKQKRSQGHTSKKGGEGVPRNSENNLWETWHVNKWTNQVLQAFLLSGK